APLPEAALFLGVANDGLPVLLNLLDPVPGPILITGDQGSGKTHQLQTIARGVDRIYPSNHVKSVVVTERPDEWTSIQQLKSCDGVLSPADSETTGYLSSLAKWAHNNKGDKQIILLLIDNLESLIASDETHQYLRWLLLRGPSRHVWPIVTLDPKEAKNL